MQHRRPKTILGAAAAAVLGGLGYLFGKRAAEPAAATAAALPSHPASAFRPPTPVRLRGVQPPPQLQLNAVSLAPPPPVFTAPYMAPTFGSDLRRNVDTHELDEYMFPPLETTGATYANETVWRESEAVSDSKAPLQHFKYVKLHIQRIQDPDSFTVHLGGIRLFHGQQRVGAAEAAIWNPHTGERVPYNGGAWTDSDQWTAILCFAEPVAFNRYQLTTSEEAPRHDPTHWVLEGSTNGTFWQRLDTRADVELPAARRHAHMFIF